MSSAQQPCSGAHADVEDSIPESLLDVPQQLDVDLDAVAEHIEWWVKRPGSFTGGVVLHLPAAGTTIDQTSPYCKRNLPSGRTWMGKPTTVITTGNARLCNNCRHRALGTTVHAENTAKFAKNPQQILQESGLLEPEGSH